MAGRATRGASMSNCSATVAPDDASLSFVCGPTPFVETVAQALVDLGRDPLRIKTERFGPTGG